MEYFILVLQILSPILTGFVVWKMTNTMTRAMSAHDKNAENIEKQRTEKLIVDTEFLNKTADMAHQTAKSLKGTDLCNGSLDGVICSYEESKKERHKFYLKYNAENAQDAADRG